MGGCGNANCHHCVDPKNFAPRYKGRAKKDEAKRLIKKTCTSLDCPERTGGECNAGEPPRDAHGYTSPLVVEPREELVKLEDGIVGDFQKARTDAMSRMFDRDKHCGGIHTTSIFYAELDDAFRTLLAKEKALASFKEQVVGWARKNRYKGNPEFETNQDFGRNQVLNDLLAFLREI